jgi:hypothetical protein
LFPLFATGVIGTGGKFAAGVVDTGGKLPPVSLTPAENLPPVSTTLAKLVAKFAAGVVDTGGKFAAGVVDIGEILPLMSLTPVATLPPVSLIPVVYLDLRISPRIFDKIRNGPFNAIPIKVSVLSLNKPLHLDGKRFISENNVILSKLNSSA